MIPPFVSLVSPFVLFVFKIENRKVPIKRGQSQVYLNYAERRYFGKAKVRKVSRKVRKEKILLRFENAIRKILYFLYKSPESYFTVLFAKVYRHKINKVSEVKKVQDKNRYRRQLSNYTTYKRRPNALSIRSS